MFAKFDLDENPGILDDGDKMRMEDFKTLLEFYLRHSTLKASDDE